MRYRASEALLNAALGKVHMSIPTHILDTIANFVRWSRYVARIRGSLGAAGTTIRVDKPLGMIAQNPPTHGWVALEKGGKPAITDFVSGGPVGADGTFAMTVSASQSDGTLTCTVLVPLSSQVHHLFVAIHGQAAQIRSELT